LPVNTSCANTIMTNIGATGSAGITAPGCGSYSGGDVWAKVVVPASGGLTITASTISGSAATDMAMAIYTAGTCASAMTLVGCDDNSGSGNMPQITLNCRTPGETLYIRSWETGNNAFGTFNLCAVATTAPANDLPCTATVLNVGNACSTVQGTTIGASASAVANPSCANYQGRDVWYQVVVPASGMVNLTAGTVSGSPVTDGGMAVYSASNCATAGTFTQLACNDDAAAGVLMPAIALTGLTPGTTLFVRFWQRGNTACGTFTMCAYDPSGNTPCAPRQLTVGGSCAMSTYSTASFTSTSGVEAPGCGNMLANSVDAWFRFTAPATGIVIIQTAAGTITDGAMALYRGTSCASAALRLEECDDNDGPGNMPFLRFADLIPGATYYLRFWGYGTATGTFDLCVWSPPPPATGPGGCLYFLEMFDSGENGWGTSAVQVRIGSAAPVSYTVSTANAFYSCALFAVPLGSVVQLTYIATGSAQGQNRYELRQAPGGHGLFMAGPSPPAGLVYAQLADCQPQTAPIEDCRGGRTICGSESFSNNALNTGFDVDLTSRNSGCLASSERKGTWYHFSPSAGGTLGFTITPAAGSIDYDFAVWGPGNSVVCKPDGPPIRCNYSGTTGATGLSAAGSNPSEGASGSKWSSLMTVAAGQVYTMYVSNYTNNSTDFTLTWQLTNGASLDCTVLAVQLISLDAEVVGEAIQLDWTTATETDADHFIVERSADMVEYGPIGVVQASGTTTTTTDYRFLDTAPLEGLNYYRLQDVDQAGNASISPAVYAIYRRAVTEMVLFPDPAREILFAVLELPEDGVLVWRIVDNGGRIVDQDMILGTAGNMRFDVPTDHLPTGLYTLNVSDTEGRTSVSARFVRE
ncbi:MAG: hypothetical protein R2815_11905, partial [Flavobacteriales bacterium]